jgi:hypothetical protein
MTNFGHRSEAERLLAESDRLRAYIDQVPVGGRNDAAETHLWQLVASVERRAQVHASLAVADLITGLNWH